MRNFHITIWLGSAPRPRASVFVALFTFVVTVRTVLITVVPLQALAYLETAQLVSVLYLCVSVFGVAGSLSIPWLVHKIKRRWTFTVAGVCAVAAALCMASGTLPLFILGMVFQVFSVAAFEISLNLYIMDHIPKKDLGHFEPTRVFFAAGAYTLGPWFGVFLWTQVSPWAPFALCALLAVAVVAFFWYLRLTENPAVAPMKTKPPNPVRYIKRFVEQPRLRLAWVLAVGRSGWWSMFFIYAPIYAVESGLGDEAGGLLVSLGLACAFLVPIWGWIGRHFGVRRLLMTAYTLSGLASIAVALAMGLPLLGAAVLLGAALLTATIDGAGNIPFLRAVHPTERAEMTTVFATYRDAGQLLPPACFAVLLKVFPLASVFVASGVAALILASYARHIPKKL